MACARPARFRQDCEKCPLRVRSGRAFGTLRYPLSANKQTFSNSLLGAMFLPVCNQKFPVPIAGNSSKEVSCFNGFVPKGEGRFQFEIPCIFPRIREFHDSGDAFAVGLSAQPPSRGVSHSLPTAR